jgi:DNA-binding transcriptional LysR family regulator
MPDHSRTAFDWDDLRFVLALARHGNLSATARALRVNHATVSRRIDSLESALGRTLFDRRADGYAPTLDGQAVIERPRP